MPPFQPLSDAEIAAQVASMASKNQIAWTKHVEKRMAERGIDKSQIKECLMRGRFTEKPTLPNRSGDIEYVFRMEAVIESENIAVGASLMPEKRVVVITVFDPTK